MADQWMGMFNDIPQDTDVFDFIKEMLAEQMFPQLGTTHWTFLFIAVALLSFTLIAILLGFFSRIQRTGWSWMIVQDGACTHISPKAWVPFFWGIMSALLIAQIAWTYHTFHNKVLTGAFSAYSVVTGAIPIMSFACLTLHVWTNAPFFRRFLIRFGNTSNNTSKSILYNRSVILINASLLAWCALAGSILVLPVKSAYNQGQMAGATYIAALHTIETAKATGNIAKLADLTSILEAGDTMEKMRQRTNDLCGYIFSSFFIFYLFGAIFPAVALNIYIRNRIKDYDLGIPTSQAESMAAYPVGRFGRNVPITPTATTASVEQMTDSEACQITVHLPTKLPKDRPFANTIEVNHTTAAPRHLQRIIDQQGAKPAEKSARLRAALRRDNQMLFAYCLLLSAMGSLAFYMLTGASNRLSASESLKINLHYEVWSFAIPASLLAALFLYEAVRSKNTEDNMALETQTRSPYSRHQVIHSLPNVITLSQQVTVTEDYAMQEKPNQKDGEEKYTMYSS